MIKKLVLILFLLSFFTLEVNASTSYTSNSGTKPCLEGPNPTDDNSGQKWIPVTNDSSAPESGIFNCEKHGYWSGSWSSQQAKNTIYNCPDNRYASKIEWSGDNYRVYCKFRDDTPPSASDLSSNPSDNSYLKAISSQNITISCDVNGGSPIVEITGKYEKYNFPGNYNGEISSDNDNNSLTKDKLETTENISLVDNNRNSNNYRPYSYNITKVCDEAGNCSTNLRTFKYNIYANNIYADGTTDYSYISGEGQLTAGNIAEGSNQNVNIYLKDRYKNKIIPVYKSDGTNIRKVGVKINYTNDE